MLGIAVPLVVLLLRNGNCSRLAGIGDIQGVVLYTRKSFVIGCESGFDIRIGGREYVWNRCAVVVSNVVCVPCKFRGVLDDLYGK